MGLIYQTSRWLDRLWSEHLTMSSPARDLVEAGINKQGEPFAGFPADLHARLYLPSDPTTIDGSEWATRLHALASELGEWQRLKSMCSRNGFAAGVATESMLAQLLPLVPDPPQPLPTSGGGGGDQGGDSSTSSDSDHSPAERLLSGDPTLLSNLDLLTVLVGEAAGSLLARYPTLSALEDASVQELSSIGELSDEDVARLIAVHEFGRRRAIERALKGTPIMSSAAAVDILEPLVRGETREVVMALALDTKRRLVTSPITVAIGTNDSAPCHPREVFRPLIRVSASACLVAHLHPSSGEPVPSPEDVMLTARLREAGELLGIPLLDHLVIGRGCFVSLDGRMLMKG